MIEIDNAILDQVYAEAEKQHPYEACGFVVGALDGNKRVAQQFVAATNIQNELHAKDPERYPRDAKTAYVIDPKEMEKIQKQASEDGQELLAIFHSHPEHGVYFSDEDKGMAAPWGEPLFPNLSYVVVSVYDAQVKNASDFYWDSEAKDFLENKIK